MRGHQGCQGHQPHGDDDDEEDDIEVEDNDKDDNNNKDDNNDKGISALGLDRDLGFLRGHQGRQGHRPHDDDDEEEEDNEVEDNDKDNDNNKDDKNDKGISSLGLDRCYKLLIPISCTHNASSESAELSAATTVLLDKVLRFFFTFLPVPHREYRVTGYYQDTVI